MKPCLRMLATGLATALMASGCTWEPPPSIPGVASTVRAILDDLRQMQPEFPQLSDIGKVRDGTNGFTYSKGLRTSIKARNPRFDRNGCYIAVEIATYHPKKNPTAVQRLAMSSRTFQHYELDNGLRYAVWTIVRAEVDYLSTELETRVRSIFLRHLAALQHLLAAKPCRLPVPGSPGR